MWKIYSLLGKSCLVRLIVRGFLKIQKYAEVFIIEFTVAGQPIISVHVFKIIIRMTERRCNFTSTAVTYGVVVNKFYYLNSRLGLHFKVVLFNAHFQYTYSYLLPYQ